MTIKHITCTNLRLHPNNIFIHQIIPIPCQNYFGIIWAPSSEFVSSSIPSWQILTAHARPFRGARDLAFFLKIPLDSLPVWASSGGSGETARMRRLAWTFAARIGDKYKIRLTRSIYLWYSYVPCIICETDHTQITNPLKRVILE